MVDSMGENSIFPNSAVASSSKDSTCRAPQGPVAPGMALALTPAFLIMDPADEKEYISMMATIHFKKQCPELQLCTNACGTAAHRSAMG